MRFSKLRLAAAVIVVAAIAIAGWLFLEKPGPPSPVSENKYVDSSLCVDCHGGIAGTYKKTGMGRSFYRLTPEMAVPAKAFYHARSDSYFEMIDRGGKYLQRRWQIGPDGKEVNVDEKQVDFVIGSGNHARTYLHLTARNTLQVLPVSWYAEKGGYWDMSPGYDHPDYPGSVRPIHYECIFCHDAYPKVPEFDGPEMTFRQPLPEGIDCQRCHGPGQKHVEIASAGGTPETIRAAIVNPKRLSPERELEVCLQCHLETTSRSLPHAIRRLDRGPFSYVPGQPLGDFQMQFDSAPGTNQAFQIADGAYRLMQSQCFLKSEGKLRCTTCHDPHDIPRGEPAEKHYNSVCANCHAPVSVQPAAHKAGADCVSCHMPKRRTDDVVHVVMTDHYIQRRKPAGDLLAAKTEPPETPETAYHGEVVAYYPTRLATPDDSLIAAIAQVRDRSNLKEGVPRLAALVEQQKPANAAYYAELAQGYRFAGDSSQAVRYYQEAAQREPSAYRLDQLGNALMEAQRFPEAEAALRRATASDPNDPVAWGTLGWVLWQENKGAEARAALEKGVALDPELPELHNNLASVLWGTGEQEAAIKEFREALRIQPGVADWRLNLARVLASRGDTAGARYQTTEAIKAFPDSAPAHELLGSLLMDRGDLPGAARELETAVRLQPDFWRAHFELGMALGRKGDTPGAIEHLKKAAGGNDPEARSAAQQVLKQATDERR